MINALKHSPLYNYIVPGLTSWMLHKFDDDAGCIRLFEMDRHQEIGIAPHSHRFNFECVVLEGYVANRIWHPVDQHSLNYRNGDLFQVTHLRYDGAPGKYIKTVNNQPSRFAMEETLYHEGAKYSMFDNQIHSIWFSRGARVLFFEGPKLTDETVILDPVASGGDIVQQSAPADWMFYSKPKGAK